MVLGGQIVAAVKAEEPEKPLVDEGSETKELDPDCFCICFCDKDDDDDGDYENGDDEPGSGVISAKEVSDDAVSDGNICGNNEEESEKCDEESETNYEYKNKCDGEDPRESERRDDQKSGKNDEDQKDSMEMDKDTNESDEEKDAAFEDDEEEEGELVDAQQVLREQCTQKSECASLKAKLDECNARVESRSKTAETCVEELLDFMHCIDHCASKTLFSKLK